MKFKKLICHLLSKLTMVYSGSIALVANRGMQQLPPKIFLNTKFVISTGVSKFMGQNSVQSSCFVAFKLSKFLGHGFSYFNKFTCDMYLDPAMPAATITFLYCLFMNHAPMDSDIALCINLISKYKDYLLFLFSPEVGTCRVCSLLKKFSFLEVTKSNPLQRNRLNLKINLSINCK